MRLLEYEAKELLRKSEVPIPTNGIVVTDNRPIEANPLTSFPVVIKSQVPVGGRGKLGGIRLVHTETEYQSVVSAISKKSIKGHLPNKLLVEEAVGIEKEYYVSLIVNRNDATIDVMAHRDGGMEVEGQTGFYTKSLDGKNFDAVGESLAELYGLEEKSFQLAEWVEKLYHCFIENDATLLEINPLILTKQDVLIAGDCKMTLDDDAAFRHADWDFEEKITSANFVTLDPQGTVATIANGAGLAMATVDAVKSAGLSPANFLDIGGGATVDGIVTSFTRIMEFPRISAFIINIFGGIVRCDDVAKAIITAREQFPTLPRLYVRLSGTNSELAAKLLAEHGMTLYPDLATCVEEVSRG